MGTERVVRQVLRRARRVRGDALVMALRARVEVRKRSIVTVGCRRRESGMVT